MNLGQNSVTPQFGGGGAEGSKMQNLPHFKPIDRKSKVVYQKSNPPSSQLGGEMGIFLLHLPSKFGWEVEIWYVHLVKVLNVSFGGLD